MSHIIRIFQQAHFIAAPKLTEKNLPDQTGKVHVVTGGYAGLGEELTKILYAKNATVYVAGRSEEKATASIAQIRKTYGNSKGTLHFLEADFSDLPTVKRAAEKFLAAESRLDVLTNNAGVMMPPAGSTSAQGFELQVATNCLGHFLFSQLLVPVLKATEGSRVTWASSVVTELSPSPGGIVYEADGSVKVHGDPLPDYCQSKVGNVYLASEFGRRHGILSVSFNPGSLRTGLLRHVKDFRAKVQHYLQHDAIYGAYTELFAGWSSDIGQDKNGCYIVPWGQFGKLRSDVALGLKSKEEGGSGLAAKFWDFCEKSTEPFVKAEESG